VVVTRMLRDGLRVRIKVAAAEVQQILRGGHCSPLVRWLMSL